MLDSPILDVGIGLLLIYLIFALVCSAINEHITQLLSLRAEMLWAGIRALLADHEGKGMAQEIYNSPFILSISSRLAPLRQPNAVVASASPAPATTVAPSDPWTRPKPSYIPADVFSLALIQKLAGETHPVTFADLEKGINNPACSLKQEVRSNLLHLIHAAGGDLEKARRNIESWYNAAMDRTSGWFKQRVQVMLLAIGFVVAFAMNADTLMMMDKLWTNKAQRTALVAQANIQDTGSAPSINSDSLKGLIGWAPDDPTDPRHRPTGKWGWVRKIIGIALTAFAASLGAPFWFGILRKFMNARSAVQSAVSGAATTVAAPGVAPGGAGIVKKGGG